MTGRYLCLNTTGVRYVIFSWKNTFFGSWSEIKLRIWILTCKIFLIRTDRIQIYFFFLSCFWRTSGSFLIIFSSVAPHRGQLTAKCHPRWKPTRRLAVSCGLGRRRIWTRDCRTTVRRATTKPPCLPRDPNILHWRKKKHFPAFFTQPKLVYISNICRVNYKLARTLFLLMFRCGSSWRARARQSSSAPCQQAGPASGPWTPWPSSGSGECKCPSPFISAQSLGNIKIMYLGCRSWRRSEVPRMVWTFCLTLIHFLPVYQDGDLASIPRGHVLDPCSGQCEVGTHSMVHIVEHTRIFLIWWAYCIRTMVEENISQLWCLVTVWISPLKLSRLYVKTQ